MRSESREPGDEPVPGHSQVIPSSPRVLASVAATDGPVEGDARREPLEPLEPNRLGRDFGQAFGRTAKAGATRGWIALWGPQGKPRRGGASVTAHAA